MKKFNNYTCWGLFFNRISVLSMRFNFLPDLIEGLCVGLAILLILMGAFSERYDISKLRNYKKTLFNQVL